jgi:hypothetical protein
VAVVGEPRRHARHVHRQVVARREKQRDQDDRRADGQCEVADVRRAQLEVGSVHRTSQPRRHVLLDALDARAVPKSLLPCASSTTSAAVRRRSQGQAARHSGRHVVRLGERRCLTGTGHIADLVSQPDDVADSAPLGGGL